MGRANQPGLRVFLALVSLGMTLLGAACQSSITGGCATTKPNGSTPPGEQESPLHHGNGELFTALWPEGNIDVAELGPEAVDDQGNITVKFPWWRGPGVTGPLQIEGEFLEGPEGNFQAIVPAGYGDTGFQATGLIFDRPGCWQIVGKAGAAELSFVTYVEPVE